MDTEKKQVFISYSRNDYKNEDKTIKPGNVISEIKKVFDAAHITYWIDEEGVYSGDEYVPVISKAIKMCDVFLFVSSQSSNDSEWTSSEIAAARMYKKKIIPLRLDDSPYNDSIILYIAHLDFIDYRKNPQDALSSLVKSVQSYLETQKLEEERLKAELESQKRKKEEEQKHLIADIELQAEELENDEREAELKRRRLLQNVQNVDDESERQRLTELINSKGSIQRKYLQEIKELKEKNDELKMKNDVLNMKYGELAEENHELKKENAILENGKKDPQSEEEDSPSPTVGDDDEYVAPSTNPFTTPPQPTPPPKPAPTSLIKQKYLRWIFGAVILLILAICTMFIGQSIYNKSSSDNVTLVNDTFPDDYYHRFQNEQGLWGFSSPSGELLIECKWKGVNVFSEGLAPVRDVQSNLCGYINKRDSLVIPYKWNVAGLFSEGFAKVKLNDKWGFIDKSGNEFIPCIIPNEPTDCHNGEARYDRTDYVDLSLIDTMDLFTKYYIDDGVILFHTEVVAE